MSPREKSESAGLWQWLGGLVGRRPKSRSREALRRQLRLEPLETRSLMATDLAAISGLVFKDTTNNGFNAGEQIVGAQINLFLDDGDGVFEPGTQDLPPPAPIPSTATSNAQGQYSFGNITAGNYWVQQPAQTVGSVTLLESHFLKTVTAAQANGTVGRVIDNFQSPGPSVTATQGVPATAFQGSLPLLETLGGERDLRVEMTTGSPTDNVEFAAASNLLNLNPTINANGNYIATWDGADGNANTLNATGLGGVDLTSNGANTGVSMRMLVDKANSTVTIRLYTNAGAASVQTITNVAPNVIQNLYFPFSSFTNLVGSGATFSNIGAIELEIDSNVTGMDGLIELVGAIGPTVVAQNFSNYTPADLAVTKIVNNPNPNVGQQIQYTVTVTNNGPNQATNVVVNDLLPTGVTFVSSTPSQGQYTAGTGVWAVGTINTSAAATLTIVATVTQTGVRTNTATITSLDQTDENPNNNTANAQTTTPSVDIAITKAVDDNTPNRNQNVTFTVTATNNGPDAATGVTVTDVLPAGLTFVSATPSGSTTYNQGTGLWTIGNLGNTAGSNSATLTIVATVVSQGPTITNTATLASVTQTDSNQANNTDSEALTPNQLDLAVVKTVDDSTPNLNQNVTFTVNVTNNGPTAATGVQITDLLPTGLTFVSATPSTGTYSSATGVWTLGALSNTAGSNTASMQIVATVTGSSVITNTATISAVDQFDTNTANNQDSEAVTPNVLDLGIAKTVDDNTPDRNQNVTFTLTLTNNGPIPATGVNVTDLLPTGLTFVSATPSVGTYASGTGIWNVGTLTNTAGQNTATLQIVATSTGTTAITNTATISSLNESDSNAANNTAAAAITPNVADLAVTKTSSVAQLAQNAETVFTITVTNNGPATATNVQITDLIPTGLTFVSVVSASNGTTYNNTTGIWNVGTLPATAGQNSVQLQVRARNTGTQLTVTNTATVTQVSQPDPITSNNTASSTVVTQTLSKRMYLSDVQGQ
ncbi:MAG: DUF11 domain-containing protein [Pirellulales bacterium]